VKFMLRGEVKLEAPVFGAVCGIGCDEIVFDVRDVLNIAKLSDTDEGARKIADWFAETLSCRFVAYPDDTMQVA
jgi:hypothetical protein